MKRMPFERPVEYYSERLLPIDEQICALLKQRKDISSNNPGFPPLETISKWTEEYNLYEEFLKSLFGLLLNEEEFKPNVEPMGFRKLLPISKSVEKDGTLYSVTSIRQYANASVLNFYIEAEPINEPTIERRFHRNFWDLWIREEYDCRWEGGGGSNGHNYYSFIVSPPLPDNLSGLNLVFKEYSTPHKRKPTALEIHMQLN